MRRSRWLRRLLVAVAAVLVALGLLEVLVRVLWDGPEGGYPPGMFVAEDGLPFRLAADYEARHTTPEYTIHIRTDDAGHRIPLAAPPPSSSPNATSLRVIAAGDSFCFGHGVEAEQAYPAQLQTILRERGRKATVVNTGVPGYSTANVVELLDAEGATLQPDVVVLGFYVGNDFHDNDRERFGTLVAQSGMLVPVYGDERDRERGILVDVVAHSRAAQLLWLWLGPGEAALTEEQRRQQVCDNLRWDPGFGTAMFEKEWDDDAHHAWNATVDWLQRLADQCAEHGWKLLVVMLPAPHQYNPVLWKIVLEHCHLAAGDYDLAKPEHELLGWGGQAGVAVLDLLPKFREVTKATGQPLYIDVHFNAAGHRLAAQEIADHLDEARVPHRVR